MDPSMLVDGVLRSILGGRRKRSTRALRYLSRGGRSLLSNPTTLLTAAGVAWGIFETLQAKASGQAAATSPPATGAPGAGLGAAPSQVPPVPFPLSANAAVGGVDDATRIVWLAVSAAQADGGMNDQERSAILEHAKGLGVSEAVEEALEGGRPLSEIVAGVTESAQRGALYGLAFTIARADEGVNGVERIYLARLAQLLGLDPATVQQLETDINARIETDG